MYRESLLSLLRRSLSYAKVAQAEDRESLLSLLRRSLSYAKVAQAEDRESLLSLLRRSLSYAKVRYIIEKRAEPSIIPPFSALLSLFRKDVQVIGVNTTCALYFLFICVNRPRHIYISCALQTTLCPLTFFKMHLNVSCTQERNKRL